MPTLPQTLRWTRAEYARLTEDGYFEGRRVQLIEGELVEMPAMPLAFPAARIAVRSLLPRRLS